MPVAFYPLILLQASVTSVVLGFAGWLLLKVAVRAWPGVAMQRGWWLLAQAASAAAFVLVLLPHSADFSVVPRVLIAQPAASGYVVAPPHTTIAPAAPAIVTSAPDEDADAPFAWLDWITIAAQAWAAIWVAGIMLGAWRWMRARRALQGLMSGATPLAAGALSAHAGFAGEFQYAGPPVLETDAAVSPMLTGLLRPRLLLPRHLRSFDPQQQRLIVVHELTHWRRRDHLWLHASLMLQTLFWFNPAMRAFSRCLNWAQELGCDHQVLAGRTSQHRQSYAAALVAQLKFQHTMQLGGYAAPAFGAAGLATLSTRIKLIRGGQIGHPGAAAKSLLGGSALALLAGSLLLQPAFAWRSVAPSAVDVLSAAAGHVDDRAAITSLPAWRAPLEHVRISSFYGLKRQLGNGVGGSYHHGIDFVARRGTPVLAATDGKVADSADLYEAGEKYGKVIVIEHAGGLRSLYAHLDARLVQIGDTVQAGQPIGRSGATGRVTGPHLHLEAIQGGQHIDPARLLAGLDNYATPAALRTRQAALSN